MIAGEPVLSCSSCVSILADTKGRGRHGEEWQRAPTLTKGKRRRQLCDHRPPWRRRDLTLLHLGGNGVHPKAPADVGELSLTAITGPGNNSRKRLQPLAGRAKNRATCTQAFRLPPFAQHFRKICSPHAGRRRLLAAGCQRRRVGERPQRAETPGRPLFSLQRE